MADIVGWSDNERSVWQRICAHSFERNEHPLNFMTRLAREHGWSHTLARAAIEEYRRFCFLAVVADHPVTPGGDVDEVWHLHLIDTHDYWETFCKTVLGSPLHHEPTRGAAADARKHYVQYAQTLASYQRYFGAPPRRFWPTAAEQFGNPTRYRRVDLRHVAVRPRRQTPIWGRLGVSVLLLLVAPAIFAQSFNPLELSGPQFLVLFIVLIIAACVFSALLRRWARNTEERSSPAQLSTAEVAYLAGGAERVVDTSVAELLANEVFAWDAQQRRLVETQRHNLSLQFPVDLVAQQLRSSSDVRVIAKRIGKRIDPLRNSLAQRGLLMSDAQMLRQRVFGALPFLALILLGLAKMQVGMERQRPVGFLFFLIIVVTIIGFVTLWKTSRRSRAGDKALTHLRQSKAHATRAPRDTDLGIAVALAGTAVLSGTAYAAYHESRVPASSSDSSSSSSGDSSSSDGGGSSCSSGCGGCGGGGGD